MKPEREEFANRGMTKENRHRRTGNGDLAEGIRNQELETNETRNLPFNWFGTTASADVPDQGRLALSPAPIAYVNIAAIKKLVVGFLIGMGVSLAC